MLDRSDEIRNLSLDPNEAFLTTRAREHNGTQQVGMRVGTYLRGQLQPFAEPLACGHQVLEILLELFRPTLPLGQNLLEFLAREDLVAKLPAMG